MEETATGVEWATLYLALIKNSIRIFPILYMLWIWLQSSYFNPESIGSIINLIGYRAVILIGVFLELAHLFEFALLYFFLVVAFLTYGELNTKKEYLALAISLSYAVVDEIHQHFVPFRSFSLTDILKDALGVWLVWLLIRKKYYLNRKKSKLRMFMKGITNTLS